MNITNTKPKNKCSVRINASNTLQYIIIKKQFNQQEINILLKNKNSQNITLKR